MSAPLPTWRLRARTGEAALALLGARGLIAFVPFARWRSWLGDPVQPPGDIAAPSGLPPSEPTPGQREAGRLARHVDRAAARLPLPLKCLPRAMALSWMLRRRNIAHLLVLAARPGHARGGEDDLHAWVEVNGLIVLGNLPGPWLRLVSLAPSFKPKR